MNTVFTKEYSIFLELLISARKEAGLTQKILSERLEKPQSFVSKYECGERRLDVIEFIQISHAIGIDPGLLLNSLRKRIEESKEGGL